MKKLLWISKSVPYDRVSHAGGKTHNFYVKKIAENSEIELRVVSFAKNHELDKLDLDDYGIDNKTIVYPSEGIKWVGRRIIDIESVVNPWNRNGCLTRNYEEKSVMQTIWGMLNDGYKPDIIILEWTQIILLIKGIKKVFPNALVYGIEVDVAFLGYERKLIQTKNRIEKCFRKQQFCTLKKRELEALNQMDKIAVNNFKDKGILIREGIEENKIFKLSPYFDLYSSVNRGGKQKSLLFYGAMSRPENWKSAIWFIKNVMDRLKDLPLTLYVVGSKPNKELMKYQSERIVVTGFVDDVAPYFENALCMVCPLLLGAGVKVKVIEAMSAGLPVLGNEIAIEGIGATSEKDYLQCDTPDDYEHWIRELFRNPALSNSLSRNARALIEENFNASNDASNLAKMILQ